MRYLKIGIPSVSAILLSSLLLSGAAPSPAATNKDLKRSQKRAKSGRNEGPHKFENLKNQIDREAFLSSLDSFLEQRSVDRSHPIFVSLLYQTDRFGQMKTEIVRGILLNPDRNEDSIEGPKVLFRGSESIAIASEAAKVGFLPHGPDLRILDFQERQFYDVFFNEGVIEGQEVRIETPWKTLNGTYFGREGDSILIRPKGRKSTITLPFREMIFMGPGQQRP